MFWTMELIKNRETHEPVNANELLLQLPIQADRDEVAEAAGKLTGVKEVINASEVRQAIKADPLTLGLRSVTLTGYLLTTALSVIGFVTYFYLSARRRAGARPDGCGSAVRVAA